MANFFTNTKNKIQHLFVYIVSCGKSSKEPSRNDHQGPSRDATLDPQDAGVPPSHVLQNNSQGQLPHTIVIQPEKTTQNQGQPTTNTPPVQENIEQEDQGLLVVVPPIQENIVEQQQGQVNSQEQKQENDDDFVPLPPGFVPEERANFPKPPGKRSAPIIKTG
ncbi:hypothetical protein FXO38_30838 [Capsicum annuum]|uniref:uncharacterized protein LOC107870182 isoform X2 n=1 Tax=Capsicum annuum TaxID=4072 RepID=UPI0007BF421E|nr:uncharacterized protein LOC107870182 isoform X2 [Capsicum annuum]KAF3623270.1 hypothetical protein FXO38_30838 [Capsicum annuum]